MVYFQFRIVFQACLEYLLPEDKMGRGKKYAVKIIELYTFMTAFSLKLYYLLLFKTLLIFLQTHSLYYEKIMILYIPI